MAGLYIHIPFCKQACHYCDFHFSTNLKPIERIVNAIISEIYLRRSFLNDQIIDTIYFGGGTPSIIPTKYIENIVETISSLFEIAKNPEITLEANPDDLNSAKLNELALIGINRLSIGIQSFSEINLNFLNRAHTGNEAYECVIWAREAGFEQISLDVIYGIPSENSTELLKKDLSLLTELAPEHISAYQLTIEKATVFGNQLEKGVFNELEDDLILQQQDYLINTLAANDYERYEISSFARNGTYARHNRNYWNNTWYLGLGPGAHSYNGLKRFINISNNAKYITLLSASKHPYTEENLTKNDKVNEYIMTSLRTKWGCDLSYLSNSLDFSFSKENMKYVDDLKKQNYIFEERDIWYLTREGMRYADEIASNLFC